MLFDSFAQAQSVLLWATFGLAMVLGLVANKPISARWVQYLIG